MQDEIVRGSCGPVPSKTKLGYVLSGLLFQSENAENTLNNFLFKGKCGGSVRQSCREVVEVGWCQYQGC